MSYNLESFCPEPWSQIEINAAGDFRICCLTFNPSGKNKTSFAIDSDGKIMNILTHSFEDAINSETHKDHRLELSCNIKPVRCINCYDAERSLEGAAIMNKRLSVIEKVATQIPEYVNLDNVNQYTDNTGKVTNKLVGLHLKFSNLCNMKCLMCNPNSSNLWYDDWVSIEGPVVPLGGKLGKEYVITKDEHNRNRMNINAWWDNDIWWDKFKKLMPDLRYLYFTGGEPFIVPALSKCLDMLIENNHSKDIILMFDTNLSVINFKILDKLKNFKKITFCVSLDDVSDRYELIRFPGKYDVFLRNLETIKLNNIKINSVTTCLGLASIYSIPRVVEVADKYNITPFFRYLIFPEWLNLKFLPSSAKKEIISQYTNMLSGSANDVYCKSMINFLKNYSHDSYTNYEHLNKFVKNMDILDKSRGTNWRVTLSDTYDLLIRHSHGQITNL